MSAALEQLAAELREEGSLIADHVVDPAAPSALGDLVAAGPAAAADAPTYAAIIECVREGYLLHFGTPRVLDPPDADLALLAGDYLYAKGLERLAALGDLASVRELSDLISLSAQLHAEDDHGDRRVEGLWLASALAIARGPSDAHEQAKRDLRERGSAEALYAALAEAASETGLDEELTQAAETVGFPTSYLG
ncbi:MAG TPA: hypothetical protein VKA36_09680 [Solirubrobacterales bacterium]|nr:hypothetical protein [Solirubrobacterales bacterium]